MYILIVTDLLLRIDDWNHESRYLMILDGVRILRSLVVDMVYKCRDTQGNTNQNPKQHDSPTYLFRCVLELVGQQLSVGYGRMKYDEVCTGCEPTCLEDFGCGPRPKDLVA